MISAEDGSGVGVAVAAAVTLGSQSGNGAAPRVGFFLSSILALPRTMNGDCHWQCTGLCTKLFMIGL